MQMDSDVFSHYNLCPQHGTLVRKKKKLTNVWERTSSTDHLSIKSSLSDSHMIAYTAEKSFSILRSREKERLQTQRNTPILLISKSDERNKNFSAGKVCCLGKMKRGERQISTKLFFPGISVSFCAGHRTFRDSLEEKKSRATLSRHSMSCQSQKKRNFFFVPKRCQSQKSTARGS